MILLNYSLFYNKSKNYRLFNRLFISKTFWKTIWRRDVSSFIEPPDDGYAKYKEIYTQLSTYPISHKYDKIKYLATNGYDILLWPILTVAYDYSYAMASAAGGGQKTLIYMLLGKGAADYNEAMTSAAAGGHKEIVKMMLDEGATNYNKAMAWAAQGNHKDIINMMLDKGANDYNWAASWAAYDGYIEIVKLLIG